MRTQWILSSCLILIVAFDVSSQIINGRLDLRNQSLNDNIVLDGEWEFCWKEFIRPGKSGKVKVFHDFPTLWKGVVGEDSLTSFGYASYRLIIDLPETPSDYGFFIEDFYCAFRFIVNGKVIATNGKVGTSKSDYRPEWRPLYVKVPDASGVLEVIIHVANFDHSKGGGSQSMKFGLYDNIKNEYNSQWVLSIVLTTLFILVAIFFLIRFGFISLDMASFYFSLFCITYSYRILGADLYVLHSLVSDYPWHIGIIMEYLTLFLSPYFFGKYVQSMYPDEVSNVAINILGIIGVLFIVTTLITPPVFFTNLITPYFVILMGYFFYAFTVFISAYINKRRGALYGILSASVAFAVFTYLMFVYFRILPPFMFSTSVAYILFILLQSLQLYTYSSKSELVQ